MDFQQIIFEISDGVGKIKLNRPDAANGMNLRMMQELHHAATVCDQDPAVRAVLITAVGKMFSAGGDLKAFEDAGDNVGTLLSDMTTFFHSAISILSRMDAPVICAVNGTAAGGGLSFAISCDLVFAAQSAKFSLAYTAAALSPDGSSSFFLPRLVGMRRAKDLMLTNRRLTADEAEAYGLVDRVVADDELMDFAESEARKFAAGPTRAFGAVKRLLGASFGESLETQMQAEARTIIELAQAPDAREGLSAFIEKRKPNFTGK